MQNSLCLRTFLTTTTAEMPPGSLGIVIASSLSRISTGFGDEAPNALVIASPDLSGRGNLREDGRSWVIELPYQLSSPSIGVPSPLAGEG